MINYFVYRINANYDDFTPSRIHERMLGNRFVFNWNAYLEALDVGDIVLVHFFGGKCKPGIYAVARIYKYDLTKKSKNVQGTIIDCSTDNKNPLISYEDKKDFFSPLFSLRKRGAEINVPREFENQIYKLLKENENLLNKLNKKNILLPGSPNFPSYDITHTPLINFGKDVSQRIKDNDITCAYFVRPTQASWINNAPEHLAYITYAFNGFKKGDMSNVEFFANALDSQIQRHIDGITDSYGLVTGIPLCQDKLAAGEEDRIYNLSEAFAGRIGLPYERLFILDGRISRRLYKKKELSTEKFVADYKQNLTIRKKKILRDLVKSGKGMILIDDVYTDGVTTSTAIECCHDIAGCEDLKVKVITLGLMVKVANISDKYKRSLCN